MHEAAGYIFHATFMPAVYWKTNNADFKTCLPFANDNITNETFYFTSKRIHIKVIVHYENSAIYSPFCHFNPE